jgi:o-succinylbenzoate synthase
MTSNAIVDIRLMGFKLRLKRAIKTSNATMGVREGILIRIECQSGHVGWGEATPLPGFAFEEFSSSRDALMAQASRLMNRDLSELVEALPHELEIYADAPVACSAIATAIDDLAARIGEVSLADALVSEYLGSASHSDCDENTPALECVAVNLLLAGDEDAELERAAQAGTGDGYRTFKIKIGACSPEEDLARVKLVRRIVGPSRRIRLDANQAYARGDASRIIEMFAECDIEYIEQPLAADDLVGMSELRATSPIAIAADESAGSLSATQAVLDCDAADFIIIKPSAVGGPRQALKIACLAHDRGVRVVVTSLIDGAVGTGSALQFAACWGAIDPTMLDCGLATSHFFESDLASTSRPEEGCLARPAGPGIGVAPCPEALHTCEGRTLLEIQS